MSLQFIMGNSGSGKSYCLYDTVVREAIENPDKKPVYLSFTMFCYFTRSASAPFGTAPTCFPVISPFLNAINVGMLITP